MRFHPLTCSCCFFLIISTAVALAGVPNLRSKPSTKALSSTAFLEYISFDRFAFAPDRRERNGLGVESGHSKSDPLQKWPQHDDVNVSSFPSTTSHQVFDNTHSALSGSNRSVSYVKYSQIRRRLVRRAASSTTVSPHSTSDTYSTFGTPTAKTTESATPVGEVTLLPSEAAVQNETIRCRGVFLCGTAPYSQAIVRLFSNIKHIDGGIANLVDGSVTSEDGAVELYGESLAHGFRPALVVYHQCGQLKRKNATHRRFVMEVPSKYVNSNETFNMGTLNLMLFYPGQKDNIKVPHFTKPLKVSGELLCKRNPKAAKVVKMYSSPSKRDDELVAEVSLTEDSDTFTVESARAAKLDKPLVLVQHQCDLSDANVHKNVYRQFVVNIPFFYYNPGRMGLRELKLGKYNLEIMYPGEITAVVHEDTS